MESTSRRPRLWPGSVRGASLFLVVGLGVGVRAGDSPENPGQVDLAQPLTRQIDSMSLESVLASLEPKIGVRLTCAPPLAGVPIILFTHSEPIRAIMDGLAEVVGGQWEPREDPPGYHLAEKGAEAQPPRRSGDMQGFLAQRLTETFEAVVQAVSADEQGLSHLTAEKPWLAANLSGPRRHLAVLLAQLTPEQRARLAHIASTSLATISATDQSHLYSRTLGLKPYTALSEQERTAVEGYFAEAGMERPDGPGPLELALPPEEEDTIYVGLVSAGARDLSVAVASPEGFWVIPNWHSGFVWDEETTPRWTETLAAPEQVRILTPTDPSGGGGEPLSTNGIELLVQASPDFLSQRIDLYEVADTCSLGQLLLAVHQQLGVSVVSDAYARTRFSPLPWECREYEMREFLAEIADVFDHHIRQQGNWLLLRSAYPQEDREYEVPAEWIARWKNEKQRQGSLGLAALCEMAQTLSERQLTTLVSYTVDRSLVNESLQIRQHRDLFLLYASLTPEQQQQAQEGGLPVADMNDAQQSLFRPLSWSGRPVFDPAQRLPEPGLKVKEDAIRAIFILQSGEEAAVQYEITF